MAKVGVAGHSFGAYTVLAVAGEVFPLPAGREASFRDPRVKAAIPMSAPAPRRRDRLAKVFGAINIPCLHMTGTLDDSPIGETKAAERRIPYDNINGADQYLVTFTGGDHMIFSGRGRLPGGAKDALFQELIQMGTIAFWDAYLIGSRDARAWLAEGGYEAALGANGKLEQKLKQPD
jgi:predicted dienelactone hydrolase